MSRKCIGYRGRLSDKPDVIGEGAERRWTVKMYKLQKGIFPPPLSPEKTKQKKRNEILDRPCRFFSRQRGRQFVDISRELHVSAVAVYTVHARVHYKLHEKKKKIPNRIGRRRR